MHKWAYLQDLSIYVVGIAFNICGISPDTLRSTRRLIAQRKPLAVGIPGKTKNRLFQRVPPYLRVVTTFVFATGNYRSPYGARVPKRRGLR